MSDYTLVHADCLEAMREMAAGSVDAIVTDPPYNAINRDTGGLRSLDKGEADSLPVDIPAWADAFVRVASGSIYVFCGYGQVSPWSDAFEGAGWTVRLGFWHKTDPSPMNGEHLWLSAVEPVVFARRSGAYFDRHCKPPVWRGPIDREISWHPTPKPVWLMRELVTASVPEGGTVLDPCMGSGATGVAARMTGRHFVGVDLNAEYVRRAEARIARIDARALDLFSEGAA